MEGLGERLRMLCGLDLLDRESCTLSEQREITVKIPVEVQLT